MGRDHKGHSDPTSDNAVGLVDKEWRQMAALAIRIRSGNCNPEWAEEQSVKFVGIYKRLLTDPIDYVKREARGLNYA
jgi:hypothetical protein